MKSHMFDCITQFHSFEGVCVDDNNPGKIQPVV